MKAVEVYEAIETACREVILANHGSISHHHGIGKIRKMFSKQVLGEHAYNWLVDTKKQLDPKNIFAVDNTISITNPTDRIAEKKITH